MKADVQELGPDRVAILSEDDIADCFAQQYREELRYVAKWNQWLNYDGARWREEETLKVFDLVRKLCRELTWESNSKDAEVKRVRTAKTVAAVVQLAKADRRLAAKFDQWDVDPMLLNTPDGVVDLKTGNVRPHRPEDYVTKMTAVGPGGACPLWLQFLDRFTGGDRELQSFLKRVCGYCLTGDTSEESLFFLFGVGRNGKGVFAHTVSGVLGDYHRVASMETFIASSMDRHPTELAKLHGARLVTATETEEGKRWDEPRIKALTGRDPISARFMRQDFFEYLPQFKLMFSGNHRPGLRTVDEAIRQRMNLIKCAAIIPKRERDPKLAEKLKSEWSGILSWMVEGGMEWQRGGLRPPDSVISTTEEYLEVEDVFGNWMDECCTIDPNATAGPVALWEVWKTWATTTNEFVGTKIRFLQKLEDRGFPPGRAYDQDGKRQRVHRGLALRAGLGKGAM
jgi:putative DNA primase/helicase